MYGALLGDMIGSPYEFDRGKKTKDFPLFVRESEFTDDSVMTIAVAEALMKTLGKDDVSVRYAVIRSMQKWGRRYPYAGYGARFIYWLKEKDPEPYNSWGNGSAMRVSAAGWLCDTLEETRRLADGMGLEVIEEGELPFWDNGVKYFTVLGPNREKVEFNQYL